MVGSRPLLPYASFMKRFLALIFLTLFAPGANAGLVEDAPKDCAYCEAWNTAQRPYQVHGNTWYVGTEGLASLLVVTDAGLILIDGALAQSAHLIVANIRQIGYDPLDIKYILNSHAHFDHAGGIAALQEFTGAQVLASAGSVAVLRSGEVADSDPQYNFGVEANRFPAVRNVDLIGNEETLALGNTTLTAHYTPGHAPGGTTWTWRSCEESTCLNIVYADSLSGHGPLQQNHSPWTCGTLWSRAHALIGPI